MELSTLVSIGVGLLLAATGLGLIVLQLRGRPAGAKPPSLLPRPGGSALRNLQRRVQQQFAAVGRTRRPRAPSAQPLSSEAERQQRLQEMRSQRTAQPPIVEPIGVTHPTPQEVEFDQLAGAAGAYAYTTPAESAAGAGELLEPSEGIPADLPRRGGRAPRNTAAWREAVAQRTAGGPSLVVPIVGGTLLFGLVLLGIALIVPNLQGNRAVTPGSAVLLIADFGERADYVATSLGHTTADTIIKEVQNGWSEAARTRMPIRGTGVVRNAADAAREMGREQAQAVLWGTLPSGATGPISATLTWRGSPAAAPWLRFGAVGRLLVPDEVPLPDQPLVAKKALTPLLAALQYYGSGDYGRALDNAGRVPADAAASTQNLAAFIRANSLVALDRAADAAAIYRVLEQRGWTNAALYNNWGVATTLTGDPVAARDRLGRGAVAQPPPAPAALVMLYTNAGIAAEEAGNLAAAQQDFDEALKRDPAAGEANGHRGYLAYRQGNAVQAQTYTVKAAAAQSENPEWERQIGLISLMQRQPQDAVAHLQKALQIYSGWVATLRKDEGALQSRNNQDETLRVTNQIRALNKELGTTDYYIGLGYTDQAWGKPREGVFQTAWRKVTNNKSEAERAIDAFQEAIRLDEDRPDVRQAMGTLYWHEGDRKEARDSFARAKELLPSLAGPYESLAAMDLEDKNPDAAIAEYAALTAARPDYLPAYIKLAKIHELKGDTAGRDAAYSQAAARTALSPRDHLDRGRALAGLGRPEDAAAEARTALSGDASLWEAHLLLATVYQGVGQNDPALAEYDAVLKQQPRQAQALYETGRILAATGHGEEARKQWVQLVNVAPDHADAHYALGLLYEQRATTARQDGKTADANGWVEQALSEYKAAVAAKVKQTDDAYAPDATARALEEYNVASEKQATQADALYHLGLLYEGRTAWKEAEKDYAAAVKQNPDLVEAWQGLVHVQMKQPGRGADALKSAQAFRQRAPADVRAQLLLAETYLAQGDANAALLQYQDANRSRPGDPGVLFGLGRAYAGTGDLDSSERYYQAAIAADPHNLAAITALGDLYLQRDQNGPAQDAYRQALALDSRYAPAYMGLGRMYDRLQQADQARDAFQSASKFDPGWADPHYYLGKIYDERNLADQALREFSQAASLRPSWALPQQRLGGVYLALRKIPEALKAYQEAVKLDPNVPEAWFGVGQAQRDSGNRKEAIKAYRRAIELQPSYAAAWLYLGYTLEEDGQRADAATAYRTAAERANADEKIRSAAQEALRRVQ
ncbi:MAG TPA: tetratricopeptide repeat protein [Chloroflexia bacterium]|nr:tetratricopeptide repeat protein [Chloroflexia bacterium]